MEATIFLSLRPLSASAAKFHHHRHHPIKIQPHRLSLHGDAITRTAMRRPRLLVRARVEPPPEDASIPVEDVTSLVLPDGGSSIEKSLDGLIEIFQAEARPGFKPTILLKLLSEHFGGEADYLIGDKGTKAAEPLRKEWETKYSSEKYELGLLLIDIFIYEGDLEKANGIVKTIEEENLAITTDTRYQLRKNILGVMLAVDTMLFTDSMGIGRVDETGESKDLKKDVDRMIIQLIKYRKGRDGSPPSVD